MQDHATDRSVAQGQSASIPRPGDIMPELTLLSSGGERVRPSDHRGRRNLILVFCGPGDSGFVRRLLREFSQIHPEFVNEESQVMAIVQGPLSRAQQLRQSDSLPFPVLADESGRAHLLVGASGPEKRSAPAIYVIDRFGEIRHVIRAEPSGAASTAGEVLGWVRYISLECPE